MKEQQNYTYIIECADGTFYTGWTTHLQERLAAHNSGKGAKYTKSRRPVQLVYYEISATRREAMRREWEIKQLTREQKQVLIAGGEKDVQGISWRGKEESSTGKSTGKRRSTKGEI